MPTNRHTHTSGYETQTVHVSKTEGGYWGAPRAGSESCVHPELFEVVAKPKDGERLWTSQGLVSNTLVCSQELLTPA